MGRVVFKGYKVSGNALGVISEGRVRFCFDKKDIPSLYAQSPYEQVVLIRYAYIHCYPMFAKTVARFPYHLSL